MTSFSEQVNNGPVIVSLLKVRQLQTDHLAPPQAAAQQDGENGMVSLALRVGLVGRVEKPAPLSAGEPIAEAGTKLLRAFHTPDTAARSGLSNPLSEPNF